VPRAPRRGCRDEGAVEITKPGKPVARVVAAEPPPSLRGSVTTLVSEEELIAPLDEPWDAER
jgi:antitoxin (DNA-binding transcriptional repressor) of toxin-antitoxin stability system